MDDTLIRWKMGTNTESKVTDLEYRKLEEIEKKRKEYSQDLDEYPNVYYGRDILPSRKSE